MFIRGNKKAQTTAEYAIVIALVIGAVVAMQVYVRRGLQGRIKDVVDHTGVAGDVGGENLNFSGGQYEPYYMTSNATTSQNATESQNLETGGVVNKDSSTNITVNRIQTQGWDGQ